MRSATAGLAARHITTPKAIKTHRTKRLQRSTVHHHRATGLWSMRANIMGGVLNLARPAGRRGEQNISGWVWRAYLPFLRSTLRTCFSPELQCGEARDRENRGDNPEPDHDGRLLPPFLFEMVVQRRHAKNPPTGQLYSYYLYDHRDRFEHEQAADNGQHQFVLGHHADRTERTADRQRPGVAHKDHRRRRIKP